MQVPHDHTPALHSMRLIPRFDQAPGCCPSWEAAGKEMGSVCPSDPKSQALSPSVPGDQGSGRGLSRSPLAPKSQPPPWGPHMSLIPRCPARLCPWSDGPRPGPSLRKRLHYPLNCPLGVSRPPHPTAPMSNLDLGPPTCRCLSDVSLVSTSAPSSSAPAGYMLPFPSC